MKRNGLKNSVYIGDTQGDCDAASLAGIPFGYTTFGFGKVDRYDYIFNSFPEILNLTNEED